MIGLLRNEEIAVFAQQLAEMTFVNNAVRLQPQQEDIRIAVEQQPDKFPQLIEDAVPFAFPFS
jgi:hypothetical protein